MTSSDTKINLVINRLKRHQYENLKQQGKLEENQLYLITDDQSASALISSALSSYYKKTETSSATEIQDAFDNIELTNYYTKSETSSATQLTSELANYAKLTSLTAYETKADLTSNYYKKTETSSAAQLTAKFGDYYTKAQVDQISTDLSTQIMQSVPKTVMRRWYSDDVTIMQYSDNTTTSKDIVGTLNTSDLGE